MIRQKKNMVLRLVQDDIGRLENNGARKVTPEKAVSILAKQGIKVNLNQAAGIVEFLYKLAELTTNK